MQFLMTPNSVLYLQIMIEDYTNSRKICFRCYQRKLPEKYICNFFGYINLITLL